MMQKKTFYNILEHSETAYLSQVIEVNSRDPKSLFIHLNEIIYKQKENPIS